MTDPKIPDIGKYHIVELVGEGAMGVVYKATDSVLNRTVAIKVMNDAIARQDELRARFLREAQAAASLQHPNVVSIYDLGEVDGHLYIAMEYVQGADLETIERDKDEPLSLQQKLDIVIDVLTGLSLRAQARHRAPRHQAGEHPHRRGRPREDHGLRCGAPRVVQADEHGRVAGHAELHGAGADHGREDDARRRTSSPSARCCTSCSPASKPFDAATLQNLFYKILTEKPTRPRAHAPVCRRRSTTSCRRR